MKEKIKTIIKEITLERVIKLSIIFTVLLIGFAIFYHYVIFLPQKEEARLEQQRQEQLVKEEREQKALEQEQKEYVAKRKLECYSIYEKERDKWNNVDGSFYREEDDVCVVRYTTDKYKGVNCGEEYEGLSSLLWDCITGTFTKEF